MEYARKVALKIPLWEDGNPHDSLATLVSGQDFMVTFLRPIQAKPRVYSPTKQLCYAYVRKSDHRRMKTSGDLLHRTIMYSELKRHGYFDLEIDHINMQPLDNRRENLRVVSHPENMQNRQSGDDRIRAANQAAKLDALIEDLRTTGWFVVDVCALLRERAAKFNSDREGIDVRIGRGPWLVKDYRGYRRVSLDKLLTVTELEGMVSKLGITLADRGYAETYGAKSNVVFAYSHWLNYYLH